MRPYAVNGFTLRRRLVAARIPEELARQLKVEAAQRGMKSQDLIAEALVQYLKPRRGGR